MIDVSVIVPFFNDRPYLSRCILSVLVHDIRELILVDDGSTDGSKEIAALSAKKYPNIRLITHDKNKGRSAARNAGLRTAKSKWVAFCDADDYYLPDRFISISDWEKSKADGFYNAMITMYERQEYRSFFHETITSIREDVSPVDLLDYLITNDEQRFSLNTLILKRSSLDRVGMFDEALMRTEDTDWIWRAAAILELQRDHFLNPVAVRWIYRPLDDSSQDTAALSFYKKWHLKTGEASLSPESRRRLNQKYCYFKSKALFPYSTFLQAFWRSLLRW